MAGGPGCFPCLVSTGKGVSSSFNVAHRLHMRQLRGNLRPTAYTYPICRSLFGKIPGRLGIPLKNIVDTSSLLEDGHIFLGFSKGGQFVLSYTLLIEADERTAFPVYIYQLVWWKFQDNKPMFKVSEVRLFNEEEIQQDLYIAVCSWPVDCSKVLVYGCCMSSKPRSEEKLMCYVTITAVPSLTPCPKCLYHKYSTDNETMPNADPAMPWVPPDIFDDVPPTPPAPPCCLQHSFAVHTKYELSTPFPSFSPKYSLARDGLVVLNTGDSIIALAVDVGDTAVPSGSLYSPLLTPSRGSSTQRSSLYNASQRVSGGAVDSEVEPAYPQQTDRHSRALPAVDLESYQLCDEWDYPPENSPAMFLPDSEDEVDEDITLLDYAANITCNTTMGGTGTRLDDAPYPTGPFDNASSAITPEHVGVVTADPVGSAALPEIQVTPQSPIRIEATTMPQETISADEISGVDSADERSCSSSNNSNGRRDRHKNSNQSTQYENTPSHTDQGMTGGNNAQRANTGDKIGAPSTAATPANALVGPYMSWSSPLRCGGYTISDRGSTCGDDGQLGSEIEQHCPFHYRTLEGSIQGSQHTMQECTCRLLGFMYSVRRYVERAPYHDYLQPFEPDTFDYHSMVPLVVCGTQKSPMVITNRSPIIEGSHVEVKQLTIDAEHYLCATIRNHTPWAKRYLSFTDYDMQVLDVCGDSCNVVVMIIVLIRAWPEPKVPQDVFEFDDGPINEMPKLYETEFKFSWNLKTGQYQTIEVGDLKEFDQAQLRKTWNPGRQLCQRLQRDWAIPQGHARGVHVLTNEAVFKNKSLRKLLDPVHYVAIVLT